MKILLDQGTPEPLKSFLTGHDVQTVFELGWSTLTNGELLSRGEASFDLLITTDQQLRNQQNLTRKKLGIVVLMTTSWPRIREDVAQVIEVVNEAQLGDYREITIR